MFGVTAEKINVAVQQRCDYLCRRCAEPFTCTASSDPTHGYGEGGGEAAVGGLVGYSNQANKIQARKKRKKKIEERKGEEEEGGVKKGKTKSPR